MPDGLPSRPARRRRHRRAARIAIAQADTRPAITVAVPKIANTGTLDPMREQSSNASEHWLGLLLENLIMRNQQARWSAFRASPPPGGGWTNAGSNCRCAPA